MRMWRTNPRDHSVEPSLIHEQSIQERYANPGQPVMDMNARGQIVMRDQMRLEHAHPDGTTVVWNDRSLKSRDDFERIVWPGADDLQERVGYIREWEAENGREIKVNEAKPNAPRDNRGGGGGRW